MNRFTLHHGDSREVLKTLAEASVDSIVCDPPYHLTNSSGGPHGRGADTPHARARAGATATGFMGMKWDGGDVAHDASFWGECLRVAKPGAYLAAFGGSRTFHRLACAIEDAGWELRDSALRGHTPQPEDCPWLAAWAYGSGFPKSHNGDWGGTALKPAWEPIVLARKPLIGTVEENWREHGTGALNIDGCRVPTADGDVVVEFDRAPGNVSRENWRKGTCVGAGKPVERGRWPANLIHDGSPEVVALFPREAGAAAPVHTRNGDKFRNAYGAFAGNVDEQGSTFHADAGSAARFFYCSKASAEDRHEGVPTTWAKEDLSRAAEALRQLQRATSAVTTQPLDAFAWTTTWYGSDTTARYLSAIRSTIETTTRLTTASKTSNSSPPSNTSACTLAAIAAATANGSSLADLVEFTSRWKQSSTSDQMASALDAVHAALQTLFEQSRKGARGNGHPTVKPTDLMRWLIRLVTPADGLVLDPFMGSGSTGKAAMLEGMRFVGIDLTADYVAIARARIDFALRQGHQPSLMEA